MISTDIPSTNLLCALALVLTTAGVFFFERGRRWLDDLPGPKSGSWLYGHQLAISRQNDVGELDFAWQRKYGGAWRVDDCFGGELLMVSDPKAIHHILHIQGYNYPKTRLSKQFTALAFGRGVSWAAGDTHIRHRKLLDPAFTAQSQRSFYPVFRRVVALLTQRWTEKLQEGDVTQVQTLDISRGLTNATLDIIGEAVFDYHFGSLDAGGHANEFSDIFHNLFADSNLHPSKFEILFGATWRFIPESLLRVVEYLPQRQFIRFREFLVHGKRLGKNLIDSLPEGATSTSKKHRDILSILAIANKTSDSANRLSEDEVLSQVTTLLFAGHETTACTLTWLIYELAHHPDVQDNIRKEIAEKRAKIEASGQKDFTAIDLEALTWTNATIKETLRFHPISPWVTRESAIHDVIPLSEPLITTSGKTITEIPIGPGVPVLVSTCAYNRHPGVWGKDSHTWNPTRFLDPTLHEKQIPNGLYANVLTFSGGTSGCIGWRFALTEMQSTVVELVENFEFTPPPVKDKIEMLRVPVGAIMAPMVKGKFDQRTQMPLGVRPLR